MSLFSTIKINQLEARKANNGVAASVLTTLLGEAGKVGKDARNGDPNDAEVIATIKKFVKNIDDLLSHSPGNFNAILEKSILVRYLPKQLSDAEIKQIMINEKFDFADKKVIERVMTFFKTNHTGLYDAKVVTQLIKEFQNVK